MRRTLTVLLAQALIEAARTGHGPSSANPEEVAMTGNEPQNTQQPPAQDATQTPPTHDQGPDPSGPAPATPTGDTPSGDTPTTDRTASPEQTCLLRMAQDTAAQLVEATEGLETKIARGATDLDHQMDQVKTAMIKTQTLVTCVTAIKRMQKNGGHDAPANTGAANPAPQT